MPPHVNIGFLKTHKCASSSVQNILMRYGVSHNLNFVLPSSGNVLKWEEDEKNRISHVYNREMIRGTEWEQRGINYNILCLHTGWSDM